MNGLPPDLAVIRYKAQKRLAQARHQKTAAGFARHKRYQYSVKGLETCRRYNASLKGLKRKQDYHRSPKGLETQRIRRRNNGDTKKD